MHDLNTISGPLHDLLRRKANASHLPNALLFGNNATSYSLPYHDLMHHTLQEKESTMLRMLAGSPLSRMTIHSLLSRGYRLLTEHTPFNDSPLPFPRIPHYLAPTHPSQYCWALALIQYFQAADSNLHITPTYPKSTTTQNISQTPLHAFHNPSRDTPLTVHDIMDFESSYHIHFVEELFSYPPKPPHETINPLLPLFPNHFHAFLKHVLTTAHSNPSLTLGKVIAREHMILQLPHSHQHQYSTYLEGLISPNHTSFSSHAFTRSWQVLRSAKRNTPAVLRLTHIAHTNPVITNIPTSVYTGVRFLRSAIGYTTTHAICKAVSLQQLILPRLSTRPVLLHAYMPACKRAVERV